MLTRKIREIFWIGLLGKRGGVDLFSPLIKRNMSDVSKELILELRQIIKEDYGREISFEHASRLGNDLFGHFDLLAKLKLQQAEKGSGTFLTVT